MKKGYLFLVICAMTSFAFAAQVTFKLNASTYAGGATDSTSIFTVQGDFNSWSASEAGTLTNDGGDYWSVTIEIADGSYGYKFVHTDELEVDKWEENLSNRALTVAGSDLVLDLAYFDQLEPPYTPTDTLDVWFRVNMAGVIGFDTTGASVGVRGEPAPLSWDVNSVLTREAGNSYFYSGLVSLPNALTGSGIAYKFVHGTGPTWESRGGINRTATINQDTTLAWQWFNDEPAAAELDTFTVTLTLNSATLKNITDSTATVYMVGDFNGWGKTDPVTTSDGDYHTGSITVIGPTTGKDILYKFMYVDAVGGEFWEAPGGDAMANRPATISSDTTFFNYWNDIEPFTPTDSIDVWFRVNMSGVAAFDPGAGEVVGVRGNSAPIPEPATWGGTYPLDRELDTYYYSGLISFANDSLGKAIKYKFVWGDAPHWEDKLSQDRSFTLNEDTTLAFKYFNNEPPAGQIVEAVVVFSVDIGAYETMGIFSVDRDDTMQVRGGFNAWAGVDAVLPDQSNLVLLRVPGTTIYQRSIAMTKFVGSTDEYKYYIKFSTTSEDFFTAQNPYFYADMGYENPADWGGANRMFTFEGDPGTPQQLPLEYYAGVPPLGLIPEGDTVAVTFTVDMRPFILEEPQLFDPEADSVWWIPKDEWVAHVLGYIRAGSEEEKRPDLKMASTAANDSIYTITFDYAGPVPYTLVYVYEWGSETNGYDQEGGGFAAGRFRSRYIQPESSGPVWPRTYTVPVDAAQKDAPLVQEDPPELVISAITDGKGLPTGFTVSQNYPNPFNPTTEIRFTLPQADKVTFTVYNLLGQQVATLSQHFPGAGTYAFRWHGRNQAGVDAPSGIYFYVVKTSEHRVTRKMTLLK